MDRDGNFLPNEDSIKINSAMAGVIPSWFLEKMLFDEDISN